MYKYAVLVGNIVSQHLLLLDRNAPHRLGIRRRFCCCCVLAVQYMDGHRGAQLHTSLQSTQPGKDIPREQCTRDQKRKTMVRTAAMLAAAAHGDEFSGENMSGDYPGTCWSRPRTPRSSNLAT